jgi:hypothetical protein
MPDTHLVCAECGGSDIACVSGDVIYPHRPDLYAKWFWRCVCGAYVGCHRDTQEPMGTPAGPATRSARGEAHAAFDALWKRKVARDQVSVKEARKAGYVWLAQQMELDVEDMHIARFTVHQCKMVVDLCRPYLPMTGNSSGRPVDKPCCTPAEQETSRRGL